MQNVVADIRLRWSQALVDEKNAPPQRPFAGVKVPRVQLAYFFKAQQEVYQYILNTHYRRFIFSEAYRR